MTADRPGGASPVYGLYGTVHDNATTLADTKVHPFVDRVMVSRPIHPTITAALPLLDLYAAETDDQLCLPDAGLSIGVGASDPHTAIRRLRSTVEPHCYVTR
jgi:hypothetical protein